MSSYFSKIRDLPMIADQKTATNEELVLSHLRLVQSIVNKQYSSDHPLYEDLIQVGNIALMTAAELFDRELEIPFSSYATHRIKYEIQRHQVDNKFQFRVLTTKPLQKAFYNRKKYTNENGKLDRDRMSSELSIDIADIREMEERTSVHFVNLFDDSDKDEDFVFDISDETTSPEVVLEYLEYEDFLDEIKEKLQFLSDRERFIVESRYYSDEPLRLSDLGAMFGVSHQRVKQIEQAAMKKLKNMLENSFNNCKLENN